MRSAFTRAVLYLGLLVGWASCQFHGGKPCSEDAECGVGGFCHPSDRMCYYVPAPAAVKWESPADNAWVGAQVPLVALVEGVRAERLPPQLPYSIEPGDGGGALFQDGGVYQGTWTTGDDGTYTLTAYLPSGLSDGGNAYSSPLRLRVDKTPPVLTVSVPAPLRPDGGSTTSYRDPAAGFEDAYRRDEIATVVVSSTESNTDPSSIVVRVTGYKDGGASAEVLSGLSPCDGGVYPFCRAVSLDLSKPELQAFRGRFLVEATGADLAGNVAGAVQVSVPVTRWKWSFDAGTVAYFKATPAIGHEGTIYFGTSAGTGRSLYAANPDGTLKWSADVGNVQASPAVGAWDGGSETVYVAGNSTIYAMDGADGGPIDSYVPPQSGANTPGSLSVATISSPTPIESAVSVINDSTAASLVAFRPGGTDITMSVQEQLDFPLGVVTNGSGFFWGSLDVVKGYHLAGDVWTDSFVGTISVSTNIHGMTLGGDSLIGTSGSSTQGALFAVSISDGGTSLHPTSGGKPAWGLALPNDVAAIYSDATPRISRFNLSTQDWETAVSTASFFKSSPLLGADGFVYTVSLGGVLEVRKPELMLDWAWSLPGTVTVESSPNLDCSRDSLGAKQPGRPGVLYVGSNNGHLYAIVVDSRGIDTQAAWPKYQHDPRNTGNSTTDLSEFACP